MTPEPDRTSTLTGRLLLAVALFLLACGCPPATIFAAAEPPFEETGPRSPEARIEHEADAAAEGRSAPPAEDKPARPVPQSDAARAAAYQENFDAARQFQAADREQHPYGHGRRHRGFRGGGFPVGKVALVTIFGIVALRVMFAGRRPAASPAALTPAPARGTAPAVTIASRQIISLACGRCDRVLDLPRDRANRRLFCPRCGAVMPSEA